MASTLSIQVEEFINEAGKVPRVQVYRRFELVGKRFVDQALEELAQSRRLVVGATEVAPVRSALRAAERAVFGESATHEYATTESEVERARRGRPRPAQTLPQRVSEALRSGEAMSVRDLLSAVNAEGPRVSDRDLRKVLTRMKGRDVENPSWGRWVLLSAEVNQPGVSLPKRLMALFKPGVVLSRPEIRAMMPDANDGSVSAALTELVAARKLCNRRCHGYWLPGTVS